MNYVKIHKNKFNSNDNENNILNDIKIYFFKNDLKASNYYIKENFENYNLQIEKYNYIFISLEEYLKYNENINEIRKQEKINKKKLNSINKLNKINKNVSENSSIQLSFSNLNDFHSNEENNHSENNRSVTYSFRNINKINYNISNLEKQNEKNSIKLKNKSAFPNLKKKLKKAKEINENKIVMNKDEIFIPKKIKEKLYNLIIDYSKKKNKKPPNNYKEKNDEEKNKMKEEIMIKMNKLNFDEIKHINRVLKNENFVYEIELNEEEELFNKGINIDNLNSLQLKYLDDLVNCFVAYNDLFNIKNYIEEKKEINLNKNNKENYSEDENNNFDNKNNKKIINDESIDSEEKEEESEDDDDISNNDIYQQRVIYNHEKNNNDNIFAEI